MYFSKYHALFPGIYGALRSCYYLTKVKEEPLYTDMAIITGVNAILQYSPWLCYSIYRDLCVIEQNLRGLPPPTRVPMLFLSNDQWKKEM